MRGALAAAASLSVALVLAPGAVAAPPASVAANLDADRALERVRVVGEPLRNRRVVLVDRCAGRTAVHRLSGPYHSVGRLAVRQLDGVTRRPEIFFSLSSGAAGHVGVIKVVHFHAVRRGACPVPATLFRYSPDRPPLPPPPGLEPINFWAQVRDWSRAFPGREIRLEEGLLGPNDKSLCCPSTGRVTFFRYSPDRERYVVYRTRTFKTPLAG